MKKFLSFCLAFALCFSLAACTNEPTSSSTSSPSSSDLSVKGGATPEEAVHGFMEGYRNFNQDEISRFSVKEEPTLNIRYAEDREEHKAMFSLVAVITHEEYHEIIEVNELSEDTAIVTVKLYYHDVSDALIDFFIDYALRSNEIETDRSTYFAENLTEFGFRYEYEYKEADIELHLQKVDGRWLVEPLPYDTLHLIFSNVGRYFEWIDEKVAAYRMKNE